MTDARVGATIAGKYAIRRLLGTGGMGAVYEGQHVEIGKRVAIKVIGSHAAQNAEMAERFKREARAASAVESENIVQVFDVGEDPEAGLYMVMEFLTGEDLQSRLAALRGPLPVADAAAIGVQVARALAKAHAAGVVHRDLKPANVFLTRRDDGSTLAKILDFGISKLTRDEAAAPERRGLTREGMVIGTPQYMSPEQAQGLRVDARTDVWSLGAVLYEAFAGVGAYEEMPTYEATIIQIVTTKPKPLAEVAPWVPREIADVVHAALVHDPAARLADCGALAARLQAAAAGNAQTVLAPASGKIRAHEAASGGAAAPPAATVEGVVVAHPRGARGRGGLVAGAVVLLAAIGALVAFVGRGAKGTPSAPTSVAAAASGLTPQAGTPGGVAPTIPAPPSASIASSASAAPSVPVSAAPVPVIPTVPTVAAPVPRSPRVTPPPSSPRPTPAAAASPPSAHPATSPQFGAAGATTAY